MKILMIDKNEIIDRRILLEGKTLHSKGHEIMLITTGSPESAPIEYYNGIKIIRICAGIKNKKHQEIYENSMRYLNKIFKSSAVSHSVFGLFHPRIMCEKLASAKISTQMKKILQLFYSLLTFSPTKIYEALHTRLDTQLLNEIAIMQNKNIITMPFKEVDPWEKAVISYASKNIFQLDVIHAHDYPALKVAINLGQLFFAPVIYDSHELYSYQPGIPPLIAASIFNEEKAMLPYVHSTIVINEQQSEIMRKDFSLTRVAILTNATEEPANFDINRKYDLIRERLQLDCSARILLFQGGINKNRKVDLLLEGIAQTANHIHMVFLTSGHEIFQFKEMARSLGIDKRTHFLDVVPWDEVILWAASADAGMIPYQPTDKNTAISSPNKMYEFIIAGTPIISHKGLVNVDKVISKEGFGVSYELDAPKDYAAAINEMFDEQKGGPVRFRQNLLKNRMKYEWKHESKDFLQLYSEIENELF